MNRDNQCDASSTERARNLSGQDLQIIADQSGLKILRYDLATQVIERFYNSVKRFGFPVSEKYEPDSGLEKGRISEDTCAEYRRFFADMNRGVPHGSSDVRIRTVSNEYRWHHGDYTLAYDGDGRPTHAIITFHDNTDERELQFAREKWKSGISILLAESIYYIESNLTKNTIDLQQGAAEYTRKGDAALHYDDFIAYGHARVILPVERPTYVEFFDRRRLTRLFEAGVFEDVLEYRLESDDPMGRWVRANVHMTKYPFSDDVMAIIAYEDIDARRKGMEALAKQAAHDALTGILNRSALEKAINAGVAEAKKGGLTALLMVDLDNFKQVNDTLGHSRGDWLLQRVATDLMRIFGPVGVVGRFGGDEFMAFVSGKFTRQDVELMAAKTVGALQYCMEGGLVSVSASIGIAILQGNDGFASLYAKADKALYAAKSAGKCQYRFFSGQDTRKESENTGNLGSVQLQSLMEYLGGGIILGEISGPSWQELKITYASPSYFKTLGYVEEDVNVHREQLVAFILEEDKPKLMKAMWETAETGKMTEYVYRVRMPGDDTVYRRLIHITYMPGGRSDGHLIIGLICDMTHIGA